MIVECDQKGSIVDDLTAGEFDCDPGCSEEKVTIAALKEYLLEYLGGERFEL